MQKDFTIKVLILVSICLTVVLIKDDVFSKSFSETENRESIYKVDTPTYIERGPIIIQNDADFVFQATMNLWAGDGTATNPYLISDYNITLETEVIGINISHTKLYFDIQNCLVNFTPTHPNPISGIYLNNVSHGKLQINQIGLAEEGIWVLDSSDINLSQNIITNSANGAIRIENSVETLITDNNINSARVGLILMDFTIFNNVTNNYIERSRDIGILLIDAVQNSFSHNLISNTGDDVIDSGILININSHSNRFFNNTISNTIGNGFNLFSSGKNTIEWNTIINSTETGIFLSSASPNNIVRNNSVIQSRTGVFISGSGQFLLNNKIINSTFEGVKVQGSKSVIYQNLILNSRLEGLEIAGIGHVAKYNHIINSQSYGLHLSGTDHRIEFNIFENNSFFTASQGFDSGTNLSIVKNYWSDWTSPDEDSNGIVDLPYFLENGLISDQAPLTSNNLTLYQEKSDLKSSSILEGKCTTETVTAVVSQPISNTELSSTQDTATASNSMSVSTIMGIFSLILIKRRLKR